MNGSLRIPGDVLAEIDRLQQQLHRVFPRSHSSGSIRATARGEFPAINIGSTPDTIEIVVFAPGIDPKTVELSIDKELLLPLVKPSLIRKTSARCSRRSTSAKMKRASH